MPLRLTPHGVGLSEVGADLSLIELAFQLLARRSDHVICRHADCGNLVRRGDVSCHAHRIWGLTPTERENRDQQMHRAWKRGATPEELAFWANIGVGRVKFILKREERKWQRCLTSAP